MKSKLTRRMAKAGSGVALALALTMFASQAVAVPYASLIRFGEPVLAGPVINVDLNYVLNEDADEVTVELYNNTTASVVRTYSFVSPAPETTLGSHTVVWDGLDDALNPVTVGGNEFVINVRVQKGDFTNAWTPITSNSSITNLGTVSPRLTDKKTLHESWFSNSIHVPLDPTSTAFGRVLGANSVAGFTGLSVLTTALDPEDGNDGSDLKGKHSANTGNFALWHGSFDPLDPDLLWWAGQTAPIGGAVTNVSGDTLDDMQEFADVSNDAQGPRSIAVTIEGGDRVAYYASGTDILRATLEQTYPYEVISTESLSGLGIYAQKVLFDDAGNLYFLSRVTGSNQIFRWSAAVVAAAPSTLLDASNAQWHVQLNSGHVMDMAINPVDGVLYAHSTNAADPGVYEIGDTADAALASSPLVLTAGDRVIEYDTLYPAEHPWPYTLAGGLAFDWVGNLYLGVRLGEEIYSLSPPGFETQYDITTTSPVPLTDDLLLIELDSFVARSAGVGYPVAIRWSTALEIDNVGFHLNRVRYEDGSVVPAGRVNDALIPGAGSSADGAQYSYRDTLPLAEGERRGYVLVDIDANGNTKRHGPFWVQVRPSDPSGEPDWSMY